MNLKQLFKFETVRRQVLATSYIVPIPGLCVQCGICSYNCPLNIDVRRHAWLAQPVKDSRCLTCGECIARCPRAGLRFEATPLFETEK
jgi:ferredoxin